MTTKLLKIAWVRNDAPAGFPAPGKLQCTCGNAPESSFTPSPDVICNCGRRYSWDGRIKGRSAGSDTLTAYKVTFEDGSSFSTSMAATVDLAAAYHYYIGRDIDGKTVTDVTPC